MVKSGLIEQELQQRQRTHEEDKETASAARAEAAAATERQLQATKEEWLAEKSDLQSKIAAANAKEESREREAQVQPEA